MDGRRPSLGRILAEAAISAMAALLVVYSQLPPQERLWINLEVASRARRVLGVLAAREGRGGMRDELAGRDPTIRYVTAYRLALLRDRAARVLEDLRP